MTYTTLDRIVRSALLRMEYPLHYYVNGLKCACDCLRELNFHSLKAVNTILLPVDSTLKTADLPVDYVDWVGVYYRNGQNVIPLTQRPTINRLQNVNASGTPVPYGNVTDNTSTTAQSYFGQYWFEQFGYQLNNGGGIYGLDSFAFTNGFKILRERGQIQLDEDLPLSFIILEYITDGLTVDNSTRVNALAQNTIEAYIFWQFKERNRSQSIGEKERLRGLYYNELRILRAALDPLSAADIKAIVRRGYKATIKG